MCITNTGVSSSNCFSKSYNQKSNLVVGPKAIHSFKRVIFTQIEIISIHHNLFITCRDRSTKCWKMTANINIMNLQRPSSCSQLVTARSQSFPRPLPCLQPSPAEVQIGTICTRLATQIYKFQNMCNHTTRHTPPTSVNNHDLILSSTSLSEFMNFFNI